MGADESTDVLVVGGGTAGAVTAARLSEDRSRHVVLLEAGRAYPPDGFPVVLTDEARIGGDADHDWGYTARGGRLSPKIVALRGRVLGGSSAVNGAIAVRARPLDFDRWNMPDWSVDDVLPAYKELENAPDGADEFHGRRGPFPIRWRRPEGISPSGQAFIDACVHEGFPLIADFNAEVRGGVGATPVNVVAHVRVSRPRGHPVRGDIWERRDPAPFRCRPRPGSQETGHRRHS